MICYKTSKPRKEKGFTLFEQALACEFVNPKGCLCSFIKSFPQRRFFSYVYLKKQYSDFFKKITILHTILRLFIGIINLNQSVECMIDKKSGNNLVHNFETALTRMMLSIKIKK